MYKPSYPKVTLKRKIGQILDINYMVKKIELLCNERLISPLLRQYPYLGLGFFKANQPKHIKQISCQENYPWRDIPSFSHNF
jgi:hypothetical protein